MTNSDRVARSRPEPARRAHPRARHLAALAAAAVITSALGVLGCVGPDLTSGLAIPAGQTFHLGGGHAEGYRARVLNRGETRVTLLTTEASGETIPIGMLEPGERDELQMGPGAPLHLRNESGETEAALKVEVFGDTNLGMNYSENDSAER